MSTPRRLATRTAALLALTVVSTVAGSQADSPAPTAPTKDAPPAAPNAAKPESAALPDGKAVIARHIEALGGRAKLDAIASSSFAMFSSTPNGDFNFSFASKKPGKFYMRQSLPGRETLQVCDGTEAWVRGFDGAFGLVNPEMRNHFIAGIDVQGLMRNLDTRFSKATTKGIETFEGVPCHVVVMQEPGGPEITAFFSVESGLVLGKRTADTSGPSPIVETQSFTDWVEVDGVKVFRTLRVDTNGLGLTWTFKDFAFNAVEDGLFARPAEVQRMIEARDAAAAKPTGAPAQPQTPTTTPPPSK